MNMQKLAAILCCTPCISLLVSPPEIASASSLGADMTVGDLSPSEFFQRLHVINQANMAIGALALSKGKSQAVRDFGRIITDDHRDLDAKLEKTAASAGINLSPPSPLPLAIAEHKELETVRGLLETLSPQEFDAALLRAAMHGDRDAVALTSEGRDTLGAHFDAETIAAATLPVLYKHVDLARDILRQLNESP